MLSDDVQEDHPGASGQNRDAIDRWEHRRKRIQERQEARGGRSWVAGLLLIAIGAVVLLNNLDVMAFENWWALFLLLPALGSFGSAWQVYRNNGHQFSGSVRGSVLVGLVFTTLTGFFLLGIDLSIFGPILIIAIGLAVLVNAILPG